MIKHGILNPHINSLLSRVCHINALVVADRGFPFWPTIETIDISLIDDVPTVLQVLRAVREECHCGAAFIAEEFEAHNSWETRPAFAAALEGVAVRFEPHEVFK